MRPYSFDALPLTTSPPVLFQYQQTAELVGGQYEFVLSRNPFTPDRDLKASATYYFRTLTVSADVAEEHYASAILEIPKLSIYLKSGAGGPLFRDAVRIGKYLNNLPYEYAEDPAVDPNRLQGAISGRLNQIPSLIGKTSITLTVILAAQEIMDDGFNRSLKAGFGGAAR